MRTGLAVATGDYVLIQDADLEYDPEDWPKLIAPVLRGKARVVYGSRFTGERRNMLFFHWVGNRLLSLVTNVLYNTTLSDMETCYKLVDRELLARSRAAVRPLRHRARDHREDPEAPDPHLRGPDLVHRSRVRRGQEDHVARRLRGVVDAGQVPLWRLTPTPSSTGLGGRRRQLRSRARCSQRASRSVLADTSAGPVELVVVDNGSRDGSSTRCVAAHPDVRVVRAPGNVGYARAANLGTAATKAPIVAVLNPDTERRAGHGGRAAWRGSSTSRASARAVRGCATSTAPTTRRPACFPSIPVAIGHGLLGLWWPTNRFTTRYRQLDADPPAPRLVDWVSGAAIWLRRAALDDVGGWDERYFMYLEDTDLCWRLRRAGWEVAYEPSGVVDARAGREHVAPPVPHAARAPSLGLAVRAGRFTGARAVLLPFAAVYFAVRAVLAMGEHAFARSRPTVRR